MRHFTQNGFKKSFNPRIQQELGKISLELGQRAEDMVKEAFDDAEQKEKIPDWLYYYEHNQKYSKLDRQGIDFTFMTDRGPVFLQVKSSRAAAERFKMHPHHNRKIQVVVVNVCDPLEHIYERVLRMLSQRRDDM